MARLAFACLTIGLAAAGHVRAQDVPTPSFIERGLDGFIGRNADDVPGSYVSPSAADLVPDAADVGVKAPRSLQRYQPIALPQAPGIPVAPQIHLPGLPAYAPQNMPSIEAIRSRKALVLEARLVEDGEAIPSGLVWRLFSPLPALDGKLPLVASAEGGIASFEVAPGSYLLHVAFGRAGVTKRIDFTGVQTREVLVLEAGGLKLDAIASNDTPIPPDKLTFDIYSGSQSESEQNLIASDIPPDKIVRLNAGTYHVVSNYGSVNAVIRADIRVEPGKVTEATLQHRAAQLTMKLVREPGGEAMADTAWSISTPSGDVVRESVGAFSSMVLAEGEYLIVAKNRDRVYQREFAVAAGVNTDVEVLTSDLLAAPDLSAGSAGSGD